MKTNRTLSELAQALFCYAVIAFSILTLFSSGLRRSLEVIDTGSAEADFYFFYTAGTLWNEGQDLYDFESFRSRYGQITEETEVRGNSENYYPPQAHLLFGQLARLPVRTAYLSLLGLNIFLLLASLVMLGYILSWYRPIRLPEITLLTSFIATGFGRMNIREGQLGLLLAVLVLGTFILAKSRRFSLAGIFLGAVTIKPTFFPLFAGYYLLRRYYRLVFVCILFAGLFSVLPVLLTGRSIYGTNMEWLKSLRRQSVDVTIEDPSPFTPSSALMSNLEPLIYRAFNRQSPLTEAIVWVVIIVLIVLVGYLIMRGKSSGREELLDFGLVSALSLLAIYHRPYDSFMLFPGILLIYIYFMEAEDRQMKWYWGLLLIGIMLLLMLPIDLASKVAARYPSLLDHYLWRLMSPLQAWAGVVVLGALLWFKTRRSFAGERIEQRKSHGPETIGI